jgi:hypothetical protein
MLFTITVASQLMSGLPVAMLKWPAIFPRLGHKQIFLINPSLSLADWLFSAATDCNGLAKKTFYRLCKHNPCKRKTVYSKTVYKPSRHGQS